MNYMGLEPMKDYLRYSSIADDRTLLVVLLLWCFVENNRSSVISFYG